LALSSTAKKVAPVELILADEEKKGRAGGRRNALGKNLEKRRKGKMSDSTTTRREGSCRDRNLYKTKREKGKGGGAKMRGEKFDGGVNETASDTEPVRGREKKRKISGKKVSLRVNAPRWGSCHPSNA